MEKSQIEHLPEYYKRYVNQVDSDDLLDFLVKSFEVTRQIIAGLPEEKGDYRYAEGKWTIKELLNHIIDTERIMTYRALCFARGDKNELPGFEENDYAPNSRANRRTLADLMAEFKAVREASIALFKSFDETMWQGSGIASNNLISVLALGYIVAGHEVHHRKVLMERYL
jgi:uncharacterized damage-inducible protein DinB